MALHVQAAFSLAFRGDGSTTTLRFALASAPLSLTTGIPGQTISAQFSISALTAVSLADLGCSGLTIDSSALALGMVTIIFDASTVPQNGVGYIITGTLQFAV